MYHALPTRCPLCGESILVTQLQCEHCDITINGRFEVSGLAALSPEQLEFVEIFLRCEGKINRVEKELGISYPTVRSRLNDIIISMGYEPANEPESDDAQREANRSQVLEDLASGRISTDQAIDLLRK